MFHKNQSVNKEAYKWGLWKLNPPPLNGYEGCPDPHFMGIFWVFFTYQSTSLLNSSWLLILRGSWYRYLFSVQRQKIQEKFYNIMQEYPFIIVPEDDM